VSYEFPRAPFPAADTERLTRIPPEADLSRSVRRKKPRPWYEQSAEVLLWTCVLATEAIWLTIIILVIFFLGRHA
jgi:hypothetical protein